MGASMMPKTISKGISKNTPAAAIGQPTSAIMMPNRVFDIRVADLDGSFMSV